MHSKETSNLKLPLFVPSDHPDFLTDWNNAMTAIDADVTEAKETASDNSSALENVDETITVLQESLDSLKKTVDNIEGGGEPTDLTEIKERIEQVEEDISNLEEVSGDVTGDVDTIKAQVSVLDSTVKTLQEDVEGLGSNLKTLESRVDKIAEQEPVDTSELESKVTALESSVNSNTDSITAILVSDTNQDSKISTLEQKVANLDDFESKVGNPTEIATEAHPTLVSRVKGHTDEIRSNTNRIVSLENKVTALESGEGNGGSSIKTVITKNVVLSNGNQSSGVNRPFYIHRNGNVLYITTSTLGFTVPAGTSAGIAAIEIQLTDTEIAELAINDFYNTTGMKLEAITTIQPSAIFKTGVTINGYQISGGTTQEYSTVYAYLSYDQSRKMLIINFRVTGLSMPYGSTTPAKPTAPGAIQISGSVAPVIAFAI